MRMLINNPGALSTVQDLGRWGWQAIGMPVSGAVDAPALVRGNILLKNSNAAGIEITLAGPDITFQDGGFIALTGADLQPKINGSPVPCWTVLKVNAGDNLKFSGACGKGLRGYICVSGGIDVPLVMGSRSTYMKAGIGGLNGRKLQKGDELSACRAENLPSEGASCPETLKPSYDFSAPLRVVLGPQDDYIKPEGITSFFAAEYKISPSSDRMGTRFESDVKIEHVKGPDIVSDGIPMGAVQIPGQGVPIVMMADRQTTGGYVKLGVVHALDVARLGQFTPGMPVHFSRITQEEGIEISRKEAGTLDALRDHVKNYAQPGTRLSGAMNIWVNGEKFFVQWEKL